MADPAFLVVAWERVRKNKGARSPGADGQGEDIDQAGVIGRRHKTAVVAYLADIAEDARLSDPRGLAEQLILLAAGAMMTAALERSPAAAQVAKEIAAVMIERHHGRTR